MIQTVRVAVQSGPDTQGRDLLAEIKRLGITGITEVRTARVYRLEGLTVHEAAHLARALLVDRVNQASTVNSPLITGTPHVIEVAYKPGVMNPEVASILKAAQGLGFGSLIAADSSTEYGFFGTPSDTDIQRVLSRLLVNATVGRVVKEPPQTLMISGKRGQITTIPIRSLDDHGLMELSKDKLFLNLEEMRLIQQHFIELGRNPIDAELETLAQTWSEHCGHKTFKARPVIDGQVKEPFITRLRKGVEKFGGGVLSAFEDNSGVIKFYDGQAICGKVETHNSPSAIEPFGGAATGSGGVFRDIMGTGQGGKVIASTDIFCFAPPDLDPAILPSGCLNPRYLLRRIVAGVRDYGNQMGVPTNNGSIHFHDDFRAKPTVIVGAYGIIPAAQCQKGQPQPGDCVIVIGGRTGRDGIHGATFSSGEMTERTVSVNASAVQIGNPIEEKRTADAIIACREAGLIRAITDCGAGGFSSAIGEMGKDVGVRIRLKQAPLKYTGLAPWEIWVSESQERMVMAVAPEDMKRVFAICADHNVEATVLGEFTDSKQLVVTYEDETLCDLGMAFLYHGLPQRTIRGHWSQPTFDEPELSQPKNWLETCCAVLSHGNVCSKEPIVRQYDHSVQGTNALPPYSGVSHDGPNDAVVLRPLLGKPYGLVISHGLNPILSRIHPYWASLWAIAEALANFVAVGGDPAEAKLIDNFIWPFPDEEGIGALDLAINACTDAMEAFGIPFVSGKDSLSSTFRGKDGAVIKIPPVLCVSAFGKIPDVGQTISADFKEAGSVIMLVGTLNPNAMAGSVYFDTRGLVGNNLPKVDLQATARTFRGLHQLIKDGLVLACHDISEGGLFAALSEMCFGGAMGASLDLGRIGDGRPDWLLFNEMAGCFLIEARQENVVWVCSSGIPVIAIGATAKMSAVKVSVHNEMLFRAGTAELKAAWQRPMQEVFHA